MKFIPTRRQGLATLFLTALTPILLLAGCESGGQNRDNPPDTQTTYQQEAAEVFGAGHAGQQADADTDWTIILSRIVSDDSRAAQLALDQAQRYVGQDARIAERGGNVIIAYGRFGPDELDEAERELKRIRPIRVDDSFPYLFALVAPPTGAQLQGSNPKYDLRNARKQFGSGALYTLQIGVYGRADGTQPTAAQVAEFRETAEKAVAGLRRDGEAAFYYHDPVRSMITLGVFGERDHDPTTYPATETYRLKQTRVRFPNNLLNGQGIQERHPTEGGGTVTRLQPSRLVMIPEK